MTDEKQRALVSGKERVARAIVWALEVPPLRVRCVRREPEKYVVQMLVGRTWEPVVSSKDPCALLSSVVGGRTIRKYLELRVTEAEPAPCRELGEKPLGAPPTSSQGGGSGPGTGET